jgi:hypothetical protein
VAGNRVLQCFSSPHDHDNGGQYSKVEDGVQTKAPE